MDVFPERIPATGIFVPASGKCGIADSGGTGEAVFPVSECIPPRRNANALHAVRLTRETAFPTGKCGGCDAGCVGRSAEASAMDRSEGRG